MADQTIEKLMRRFITILFYLFYAATCPAQNKIIVDANGKGNFKTTANWLFKNRWNPLMN